MNGARHERVYSIMHMNVENMQICVDRSRLAAAKGWWKKEGKAAYFKGFLGGENALEPDSSAARTTQGMHHN